MKGFTLVELLIVVFVMSIIATVGGDVLISTMRSSNKANIINEINQNANFVVSTIESVMRNGKQVSCIACTSGVGKELYIIDQYNQSNYFCITAANTVLRSSKLDCVADPTTSSLTNTNLISGVTVDNTLSSFSVSSSTPPLVTITLKITQGSGASSRIDYQAGSTFTKSIELRKY